MGLDMAYVFLLGLPLVGWLLWWWNEIWFVTAIKAKCSSMNIKMFPVTWDFLSLGKCSHFYGTLKYCVVLIHKYGENVGAYRNYMYGSPRILVCSPSLSKLILNLPDKFKQAWPTIEALGSNSLMSLKGTHHDRVKSLLMNAINHPHALACIVVHVQPTIVHALQSWAQKGKIIALDELKKVTLLNMGRYFASLDFGPQLHSIEHMLFAITQGFRAQPAKIPGSAYRYAVKCRTKFKSIMRVELEKRKQQNENAKEAKDLMDQLMQMKDEGGKNLTDEEVLDNIVSSIHVGNISTAYLSTWALYFVAKDPNVLHKLREENMELAKEKKDLFITCEDVLKLKYTNKIRPRVGTYYAFGGGWKSCPGNMLVRLQRVILLHHLLIGYKWEVLNPDVKVRYLSHPLPADGLQLLVSEI
ncbi:hypothetical protein Cgig2_033196 [Carnegiea gigantea]|uniref:Cytochrome P450 n=1 Tax=Carnegiea gigantea TaxID=171969 RepID=A0A9Q1JQU3_9CARY|nr:hypothetical protein Cgig2_033196 [Carnegiea gigantea]